ncbi:Zn-ribbon domain-containing OB-fold protein [Sphingopyxis indica]|uniref:Uncharacterized OB-fold protein, contains Zn-ribbon domain n=1 Tax=Sphingopyxis indica TaxID=436663 RepID=A0A239HBI2_9SPHN|nr:zinc ribbon domain-containing protein [Sphingopyxis indica]SNS78796.1 Uncharacterized OB-fold protein, contains Zn-ribbon domain [Sphingopyxis indica]
MDDQAAALFAAQGTGALPDHPALNGGRCKACGYIFFPMQHYGCERCGSEELEPWLIGGRGRLVASAEVHVSMNPRRPAPYVVGSIATDDGAVVRSILEVPADADLAPGTVMTSRLVEETRPDKGPFDLRFAPETGRP